MKKQNLKKMDFKKLTISRLEPTALRKVSGGSLASRAAMCGNETFLCHHVN